MTESIQHKSKPGVIVIGGHVQGLGIARIYGRNGIPVILLDKTALNLTRHSKYCKKFFKYEKGKLLEKLLELSDKNTYKNWLLMPTGDEDVGIVSMNKVQLSNFYKIYTPDYTILEQFYCKTLSYKLTKQLEIPFPKSWFGQNWEEIEKMDISFPCIIKPSVMHSFYSKTKKKVFKCNDREELKKYYEKAIEIIPKDEVIIQDIIPGNSENQYSACFVFDGNEPLVTLTARRARQHPPDFGNATTYAETVELPEIVHLAKKLLKEVKYSGICEVEFKFDTRDKTFKFLEVNPRTWKWHIIAEKSKAPLLMSLYHYVYDLEPIISNSHEEACFRHLITDIPTIIKMKYLNIKYPKTKKNISYAVWQRDDFMPAFFELLYVPYLTLSR